MCQAFGFQGDSNIGQSAFPAVQARTEALQREHSIKSHGPAGGAFLLLVLQSASWGQRALALLAGAQVKGSGAHVPKPRACTRHQWSPQGSLARSIRIHTSGSLGQATDTRFRMGCPAPPVVSDRLVRHFGRTSSVTLGQVTRDIAHKLVPTPSRTNVLHPPPSRGNTVSTGAVSSRLGSRSKALRLRCIC